MTKESEEGWARHWNEFPNRFADNDFLAQVGKTENGVPVSAEQVTRIVQSILQTLFIKPEDRLLDLCCGNGLLTNRLVDQCQSIVGVDFSLPLIQVARQRHIGEKVRYVLASVLTLDAATIGGALAFDKAYMYEALQYFGKADLPRILSVVSALAGQRDIRFLIGSIPDRTRLFNFYNTAERRAEYERRLRDGTEAIGTWWEPKDLSSIAEQNGFRCEILAQPETLYTSNYRFNALLRRC